MEYITSCTQRLHCSIAPKSLYENGLQGSSSGWSSSVSIMTQNPLTEKSDVWQVIKLFVLVFLCIHIFVLWDWRGRRVLRLLQHWEPMVGVGLLKKRELLSDTYTCMFTQQMACNSNNKATSGLFLTN